MSNCQYCGMTHAAVCHRVKAIEYADDGITIRRIEFHGPSAPPAYVPTVIPQISGGWYKYEIRQYSLPSVATTVGVTQ